MVGGYGLGGGTWVIVGWDLAGKPYWWGRISTVDLLGLTSLDQVLFTLKILFTFFTKQPILNRRSTVLSIPLQQEFPGSGQVFSLDLFSFSDFSPKKKFFFCDRLENWPTGSRPKKPEVKDARAEQRLQGRRLRRRRRRQDQPRPQVHPRHLQRHLHPHHWRYIQKGELLLRSSVSGFSWDGSP